MGSTSKDLLEFEQPRSSSIESTLLVCSKDLPLTQKKTQCPAAIGGNKLSTTSFATSHVLDRVKDFLGVMAEANKKLEHEAKDNAPENYDIEVLTGNEEEYIEMDLMLGVADLHTPDAVAAAESAMAGSQPALLLSPGNSESDSGDSIDNVDSTNEDDGTSGSKKRCSNEKSSKSRLNKQPKIAELS